MGIGNKLGMGFDGSNCLRYNRTYESSILANPRPVVIESHMSTTEHDIASFNNFALRKIESGESDLTIDELFDQWRIESPSDELYAENVAAIVWALRDSTYLVDPLLVIIWPVRIV